MIKSPGVQEFSSPQWDFTIQEDWVMINLIAGAGFYNSRGLSDEKISLPRGILTAAAGFYNSGEMGDEKISSSQRDFTIQKA